MSVPQSTPAPAITLELFYELIVGLFGPKDVL